MTPVPEDPAPLTAPLPSELRQTAQELLGESLPVAARFADLLADQGVRRGLIGPREVDRLWERHILNSALLLEAIPEGTRTLADVGSGAGLPGLVVAIARPDLEVTLIETMLRRTRWLEEAVQELGMSTEVVRARAEDLAGRRSFDVVTARAVAPLEKLSGWTLPLVREGGHLVAMKGSSAAQEIEDAEGTIHRLGGAEPEVLVVGEGLSAHPTTVVRVRATRAPKAPARHRSRGARHGSTSR